MCSALSKHSDAIDLSPDSPVGPCNILRIMQTVVARAEGMSEARGRWLPAYAWLAGLVAYLVAIVLASDRAAIWINDIAWTMTSACTAWACLRTSRKVERPRRRAWLLFGLGCVSWLIGQLHWNYSQLVLGVGIPFPSIGQIFFSAFALFGSPACCRCRRRASARSSPSSISATSGSSRAAW